MVQRHIFKWMVKQMNMRKNVIAKTLVSLLSLSMILTSGSFSVPVFAVGDIDIFDSETEDILIQEESDIEPLGTVEDEISIEENAQEKAEKNTEEK